MGTLPKLGKASEGGVPLKKDSNPTDTYKKRVSQDLLRGQVMMTTEMSMVRVDLPKSTSEK